MRCVMRIFACCLLLTLMACGTEYESSDLAISDQGVFVERGSNSEIDGAVIIFKDAGDRLTAEFRDGYPDVKAVGIPLLGRTLTLRQSLPLSEAQILSKSKSKIIEEYSNIQDISNGLTFEQARQGNGVPLKFNLSVRPDGNNTMLTIAVKIPAGVATTKGGVRKGFCELLDTF